MVSSQARDVNISYRGSLHAALSTSSEITIVQESYMTDVRRCLLCAAWLVIIRWWFCVAVGETVVHGASVFSWLHRVFCAHLSFISFTVHAVCACDVSPCSSCWMRVGQLFSACFTDKYFCTVQRRIFVLRTFYDALRCDPMQCEASLRLFYSI